MSKKLHGESYKAILDKLHANVYITDTETDEIVYMNDYMKKTFHLNDVEGRVCWEVLQTGMTQRCDFCKIDKLKKMNPGEVCAWTEKKGINGRSYLNHDRLEIVGDHVYHVQHSTDITEFLRLSMEATTDELTGVLNRSAGKKKLENILKGVKKEDRVVVALCDTNDLKWINDTYGHMEGDRFLVFITQNMQSRLKETDFVFRLSGDEFVVVFADKELEEADSWMREVLDALEERRKAAGFEHPVAFSYGLAPVSEYENLTATDVLSIADTQMYIQKRDGRIQKARQELRRQKPDPRGQRSFQYNKDYLFDILSDCVEDYVFAGNLKTGQFMYSYKMTLDFGLPSQVLDNAAAFWAEKIHPDDAEMFLRSNQEIADGRADHHAIIYRAKNARGQWVHLMCKGQMIRDAKGEPELFAGIIRNLDNKAADSNEELRVISDSSTDGFFKAAMTDGFPVLYANDGYFELHGYTRRQMAEEINNHASFLIHEDDMERVTREINENIEKKAKRTVLEYRIRKRDGSIAWVHVNAGVTHLQEGPLVLIGMIMDITERRELEIRLKRTDQLFRIARKHTRLSMWEIDIQNRRIIQTEESRATHGFGEIIDNIPERLVDTGYVHPESIDTMKDIYRRLSAGQNVVGAEVRVRVYGTENEYWWEKINATIVQWENDVPIWAVGVSEDITAQREIEARVFREETMRGILTEDLLLSFRINMDRNSLEELWEPFNKKIEKNFDGNGYDEVYEKISRSIANDDDLIRLQTYYTPEKVKLMVSEGVDIPDFEFRSKRSNGQIIWALLNMKVIVSPEVREKILFGHIKNIDFLKKSELSLQRKAEVDEISGFYNVATAELMIGEILKKSSDKKNCSLLMLLDVDRFKQINEEGGYLAGDQILFALSSKLRGSVPTSWIKTRVRGNLFLIFCREISADENAKERMEQIRKRLCSKYAADSWEFEVALSAGLCINRLGEMTYEQMFLCAQYALNTAKKNGGNRLAVYSEIENLDYDTELMLHAKRIGELQGNYEYALYHDKNTSLLNYDSYISCIRNANEDIHSSFGIVGVQATELRNYNRQYGIQAGDTLLRFLAELLVEIYGKEMAYKVSGGSFRVLCPDTTYETFMERFRLLEARAKEKGGNLFVFANVWEQNTILLERMEYQVDEKLRVARISSRNKNIDLSDQVAAETRSGMQEAIDRGNFLVYFQPQVRAETGEICGAEALIRYSEPEKGVIPPGRFLPPIERAGLVRYIDLFVLKEVCRILKDWMDAGWEPFPVSLNYSRMTILEPGILEETDRIVREAGIPRNLIEIEVTESISSIDSVSLKEIVSKFVKSGYRTALDDFGAEYSNIYALYSLELNTLKLDRRIIGDIYHDKRARLVVENMIDMCKKLGITSLAEGVETEEQYRVLQGMSCDVIQGYYLNKPLPEKEFRSQYINQN